MRCSMKSVSVVWETVCSAMIISPSLSSSSLLDSEELEESDSDSEEEDSEALVATSITSTFSGSSDMNWMGSWTIWSLLMLE